MSVNLVDILQSQKKTKHISTKIIYKIKTNDSGKLQLKKIYYKRER